MGGITSIFSASSPPGQMDSVTAELRNLSAVMREQWEKEEQERRDHRKKEEEEEDRLTRRYYREKEEADRRIAEDQRRKQETEQRKREAPFWGTVSAVSGLLGTFLICQSGVEVKLYMQIVYFTQVKSEGEQARIADKLGYKCPTLLTQNLLDLKSSTRVKFFAMAGDGAGLLFFGIWSGTDFLVELSGYVRKKKASSAE